LKPSFRCKQFIPKSLSPMFCRRRNRRDY
jgi:hypothetical protein